MDKRVTTARRTGWRLTAMAAVMVAAAMTGAAGQSSSPWAAVALTWEPNPEPQVTGYFVFVGTEPGVYGARYEVGLEPRFRYVGMAGQQYFFAVAARSATAMSPLSAEVAAVGKPWFAVTAGVTETARSCADCAGGAFRTRGLGAVSALTPTGDGRLFFIEDGRHVRIAALRDAAVLPPALSAAGGVRFTGLALAADFERSGHVFLAAARQRADGTRDLTLARYRVVQNQMGEGTAIISGLRLWSDRDAPFTVDGLGRIYVAMPGDGRTRDPYAGHVLWFEGDGRVPADARGGSPILAVGFAAPVAVVADGGDLWLVGADAAWGRSIARIAAQTPADGEWPRIPAAVTVSPAAGADATARAFDAVAGGGAGLAYVIDSEGYLQMLQTSGSRPIRLLRSIERPSPDTPVAVAAGISGEVFVAVRRADGTFAIEQVGAVPGGLQP